VKEQLGQAEDKVREIHLRLGARPTAHYLFADPTSPGLYRVGEEGRCLETSSPKDAASYVRIPVLLHFYIQRSQYLTTSRFTVISTLTKHTIILRTSRKVSVTSAALSARKSTSYQPLPLPPKPKQLSLPLHPRSHNQRPSVMPSPVPVWPAVSSCSNNTQELERTHLQQLWRSMPWPANVLVKQDLLRTPRSKVDS
jgi:hypothetical protein